MPCWPNCEEAEITLVVSGMQQIRRDRDVPARTLNGLSQDLAVLQDHELRIDIDTAAAAGAVENRRTDLAIGELHRAAGVRRDLDRPAARLIGLSRHRAICHRQLVTGVDLDIPRVSLAGALRGDYRSTGEHDEIISRHRDVAAWLAAAGDGCGNGRASEGDVGRGQGDGPASAGVGFGRDVGPVKRDRGSTGPGATDSLNGDVPGIPGVDSAAGAAAGNDGVVGRERADVECNVPRGRFTRRGSRNHTERGPESGCLNSQDHRISGQRDRAGRGGCRSACDGRGDRCIAERH